MSASVILPGTTSACAENTFCQSGQEANHRNYLRVRGEYPLSVSRCRRISELPPRARRIRCGEFPFPRLDGTTSACAENTSTRPLARPMARNYLRVRGEYIRSITIMILAAELPPRARRIHLSGEAPGYLLGTTSACAENTPA